MTKADKELRKFAIHNDTWTILTALKEETRIPMVQLVSLAVEKLKKEMEEKR